ncbi:hypothetical protein BD410DRAFT_98886 [Rickenella mellea]|uniref:Uncharacterized protein n=1 Tax=Rickenella mellea TaxID=50990 RepID=A0A4Y7QB30_9AGAM|nr:hypothetical protein BD410DRAFT_98886 [Rickenella mellea]
MNERGLPLSSQHLQRSPSTGDNRSRPLLQDRKLNVPVVPGGTQRLKRKRKPVSSPPRAFLPGHTTLANFQKLLQASRDSARPATHSPTKKTGPIAPNPLGHRDRIEAIDALVSILMCHRAPPGLMIGQLEDLFLDQLPFVLHGQFIAVLNSEPFFIRTILEPNSSRHQGLPIPCIMYDESLDDFHHERLARIQKRHTDYDNSRRGTIATLFGDEVY